MSAIQALAGFELFSFGEKNKLLANFHMYSEAGAERVMEGMLPFY